MAEPEPGKAKLAISIASLALIAAVLTLWKLNEILPSSQWPDLTSLPETDIQALIFGQVALPRVAVSLLVGAGLSFSGVLIQQCLRNPLADTTTLGLSSGSYLAIATCAIFAPALLDHGQPVVALGGAALVAIGIMVVGRSTDFSPSVVLLTGLSINLFCGAAGAALTVLNHEFLSSLFVWQSGNLVQNGWATVRDLSWQFGGLFVASLFLVRPLSVMELGDTHARGLGIPVTMLRAGILVLAISFGALATSSVGVIGFVGLASPNIVRMLGARTFAGKLFWASLLGAVLLWLADQSVQHASLFRAEMPTGSAVGMFGAPIMLWLLSRTKLTPIRFETVTGGIQSHRRDGFLFIAGLGLTFTTVAIGALFLGRSGAGWHWLTGTEVESILPWRLPRVAAAASSGALLAFAGVLLQRLTGNPIASPDVLGISSGAAMGVIGLLLVVPTFSQSGMVIASALGAGSVVALILALNARAGFSPGRLLLSGMALSTLFSALAATVLSSGDPRSAVLLAWMSGSTYRVTETTAIISVVALLGLAAIVPFIVRWLEVLPFGRSTARSLGLNLMLSRAVLLFVIAISTGIATISTGPLTFVGLIAPHMARALGFRRPLHQSAAACLMGAVLLVLADWLGRNLLYPWQLPAGLISSMLGVLYFLFCLRRSSI